MLKSLKNYTTLKYLYTSIKMNKIIKKKPTPGITKYG